MTRRRLGRSALVLLAAGSVCLTVPSGSSNAAASSFCAEKTVDPGPVTVWSGKGDGHNWDDAANWSPAKVPDAAQTPATYQNIYVCIGTGAGSKAASVTIAGTDAFHVAGLDVGQGADLLVKPGGRLFLGAPTIADVLPSTIEKASELQLDASTLGGDSPLTVAGTMHWTGRKIGGKKEVATQTSSECVFDPSIEACPGDTTAGGGKTLIAAGGKLLIDGGGFGGVDLSDGRALNNSGTVTFTKFGFIAMDNGTKLTDESHSVLQLNGAGGIYQGVKDGSSANPKVIQRGRITRNGKGNAIIGVPVTVTKQSAISIVGGTLVLHASKAPKSPAARNTGYGVGSCELLENELCRDPVATSDQPEDAIIGTSTEAPKTSKIAVALVAGAKKKVDGHSVLGKAIDVTAPTEKTTHSTHLTFKYDATTAGLKPGVKPTVYRDGHAITYCKVHGLTAENTSCVLSAGVDHTGSGKGDLTVIVISIQPDGTWMVAS